MTSSFRVNLSENHALHFALFVNEYALKLSEQWTEFLLTQSGSSLKIKFIHSKEGNAKTVFPQLGTAQHLVLFGVSL